MLAGACAREGGRDSNDVSIGCLELLSEIDFVSRRILEEDVGVGDLLADTDGGTRGRVEASGSDGDGRSGPGEGDSTERSSERHG